MEDIRQKMSCWLPDVKRLHGYILKVSTRSSPMQDCKGVDKKLLDLICVDTHKSVDPSLTRKFDRDCARECKTKNQLHNTDSLT